MAFLVGRGSAAVRGLASATSCCVAMIARRHGSFIPLRGGRSICTPAMFCVPHAMVTSGATCFLGWPHDKRQAFAYAVWCSMSLGCAGLTLGRDGQARAETGPEFVQCNFLQASKGWEFAEDGTVAVRVGAGDLASQESADSGHLAWTVHVSGSDRVLVGAQRDGDALQIWGAWVKVPPRAGRFIRVICDLEGLRLKVSEGDSVGTLVAFKEGRLVHEGLVRLSISGAPGTTVRLVSPADEAGEGPGVAAAPNMDIPENVEKWLLEASRWQQQMRADRYEAAREAEQARFDLDEAIMREEQVTVERDRAMAEAERAKEKRNEAVKIVEQVKAERDAAMGALEQEKSRAAQRVEDVSHRLQLTTRAVEKLKSSLECMEAREQEAKAACSTAVKEASEMKAERDVAVKREAKLKMDRVSSKEAKREKDEALKHQERLKSTAEQSVKEAERTRTELEKVLHREEIVKMELADALRDRDTARKLSAQMEGSTGGAKLRGDGQRELQMQKERDQALSEAHRAVVCMHQAKEDKDASRAALQQMRTEKAKAESDTELVQRDLAALALELQDLKSRMPCDGPSVSDSSRRSDKATAENSRVESELRAAMLKLKRMKATFFAFYQSAMEEDAEDAWRETKLSEQSNPLLEDKSGHRDKI